MKRFIDLANERDARDTTRAHSPLQAAPDATLIDTTELSLEQVVERIVALASLAASRGCDA